MISNEEKAVKYQHLNIGQRYVQTRYHKKNTNKTILFDCLNYKLIVLVVDYCLMIVL